MGYNCWGEPRAATKVRATPKKAYGMIPVFDLQSLYRLTPMDRAESLNDCGHVRVLKVGTMKEVPERD